MLLMSVSCEWYQRIHQLKKREFSDGINTENREFKLILMLHRTSFNVITHLMIGRHHPLKRKPQKPMENYYYIFLHKPIKLIFRPSQEPPHHIS